MCLSSVFRSQLWEVQVCLSSVFRVCLSSVFRLQLWEVPVCLSSVFRVCLSSVFRDKMWKYECVCRLFSETNCGKYEYVVCFQGPAVGCTSVFAVCFQTLTVGSTNVYVVCFQTPTVGSSSAATRNAVNLPALTSITAAGIERTGDAGTQVSQTSIIVVKILGKKLKSFTSVI